MTQTGIENPNKVDYYDHTRNYPEPNEEFYVEFQYDGDISALKLHIDFKYMKATATVCIRKPFALSVCSSQVNALIRLYTETEPSENGYYTLAFGTELIINPLHRQVKMNGSFLNLTRKEFDLLYYMASHPGQVFSRTQLYNRIWQDNSEFNIDEVVRFHVQALRRKLSPSGKDFIQTVWGIGYRFIDND